MVFGSIMLIDSPDPAARISLSVILTVVGTIVVFFAFGLALALKARSRRPTTGDEGMIGQIGTAREAFDRTGMVHVAGEYWRAKSGTPLADGAEIRVVGKDGMTLLVEPVET